MICKKEKFYFAGVVLITMMILLAGCGSDVKNEQLSWTINVQEYQVKDKMETVDDVRQYDGSIAKVSHNNIPSAGNVFLLIKLEVKKNVSGNHPLKWQDVTVQDNKGNVYKRIQDVFLKDYKYDRFSATDLKLDGSGWVCFEISAESVKGDIKLIYADGDKSNVMNIEL